MFMTGFYSKDFILESAYGQFYFSGTVVYFIATIGAMFTTLYSVKVLSLTFLTNPLGAKVNYFNKDQALFNKYKILDQYTKPIYMNIIDSDLSKGTHSIEERMMVTSIRFYFREERDQLLVKLSTPVANEGNIFMSLPLVILAIFSIFFGYITKDIFIGLGSGFYADNSIFIHPTHEIMINTEFALPTLFKLLPLIFTITLSIIAIILSEFCLFQTILIKLSRIGYNIFGFFNQRFLIELFYNKYITYVFKLGGQTKVLDKGSVESLGPFLEKGLVIFPACRNI